MKKSFLEMLKKNSKNEDATIMVNSSLATPTEYISTGCYSLNALISADVNKGIPNNRTVMLAAPPATGKSFIAINIMREAIKKNYNIIFYDSENALDREVAIKRGLDVSKILHNPVDTVENFRDDVNILCETISSLPEEEREKTLIILDSLGNLASRKEINDVEVGNDKVDMTRPKIIKSLFRVLQKKLSKLYIPMIVINHVYDNQTMFGGKSIAGGQGAQYFSSITITLSKSKVKDGTNVTGFAIKAKNHKNRFAKEEKTMELFLDLGSGLHPYYGLHLFNGTPIEKAVRGFVIKDGDKEIKISTKDIQSVKDWKNFDSNILERVQPFVKEEFEYPDLTEEISNENQEEE